MSKRRSVQDTIQAFSQSKEEDPKLVVRNEKIQLKTENEELKNKLNEIEKRLEEELKKNEIITNEINELKKENSNLDFNLTMEKKKFSFMKMSKLGKIRE